MLIYIVDKNLPKIITKNPRILDVLTVQMLAEYLAGSFVFALDNQPAIEYTNESI